MALRTGRPKSDNPMNDRLYIGSYDKEATTVNLMHKFAKENGYTLLELIRIGVEKVKEK